MSEELYVELSYTRRYVTGQFQHKEYALKVAGTERQISEQIAAKRTELAKLVSSMEGIVTLAHEAHQSGKTVDEIVNVEVVDNSKPAKVEETQKQAAKKEKNKDLEDIF